jgi:hypothetical protein
MLLLDDTLGRLQRIVVRARRVMLSLTCVITPWQWCFLRQMIGA